MADAGRGPRPRGRTRPSAPRPDEALGPAAGTSADVVCLGRGGSVTLTFEPPIRDGEGADLAVFESGFTDTFLELAFVEVSSDGEPKRAGRPLARGRSVPPGVTR